MRLVVAALVLALPSVATAQSTSADRRPVSGLAAIGLPLPSITSTLPSIGLGLSPIGLAPQRDTTVRSRSPQPERPGQRPRPDARRHTRSHATVVYVVAPPFYMDVAPSEPENMVSVPPAPSAPPAPASGVLQLELDDVPRGAQVYVDRYFVGTLEELSAQLRLETGPHQIEIQAVDHEPLTLDVRIVADRSITYRGALQRVDGNVPKAEPRPAPATIYFIPGCYLGNVPPAPSALPTTCDISKLTTYKP